MSPTPALCSSTTTKQWVGMLRTLETPRDCSVQLESFTLEQVLAMKFDAKGLAVDK